MKKTTLALSLIVGILVSAGWMQGQPKAQQWEYKFDYKCHEKSANDLAIQGWELIAVDSFTYSNVTGQTCAFKRGK